MRVTLAGLLLLVVSSSLVADDRPAWTLTLEERAVRRADPVANAARHQAWVAKGRHPMDPTTLLVDGSMDPTIFAPIELIDRMIFQNLDPQRVQKFRRDWTARGAARLLGPDFWPRLEAILAPLIALDRETRRLHSLPQHERDLEMIGKEPKEIPSGFNDDGTCAARAQALIAGRKEWGRETFDRFLYEVVAPGASFSISSSAAELMRKPEYWMEEWKWMEEGCR